MVRTNILQRNGFSVETHFLHMCGSSNLCIGLQQLAVLHFFSPHIHRAGLALQRAPLVAQGQSHELLLQLADDRGVVVPADPSTDLLTLGASTKINVCMGGQQWVVNECCSKNE